MTSGSIIEIISIDTQVFVATGYCFSSNAFESLKGHFASGRLRLVMTDITIREVRARIRQSVTEELVHQRSFVNKARVLFNSSIPEVKNSLKKVDVEIVAKDLCDQFDVFLKEANAEIVETYDLTAGDVLDKYFGGEPPFQNTETKKYEFPDAFAIQALGEWADDNDLEMFIVSGDELFREACDKWPRLSSKKELIEVLDHIASDDAKLADFVRGETLKRIEEISKTVKKDFEDRYYWVDDQDGDAQVEVTAVNLTRPPEIIEIDKEHAILQLNFDAKYSAALSYNDSATASHDPEDGALLYVERREEEVEDEQELVVEVEVSYDGLDPATFEIMDVSLTEPSDGFGIETQDARDWPYK
jgi:hypothetical protein